MIKINGLHIACQNIIPDTQEKDTPIVFLHDSLGCISTWKEFPKLISDAARQIAIVYDRQGYGHSDPFSELGRDLSYLEKEADFLIQLLDKLGINKCILFGHSDGGSISVIAAGKYPERIAAIITEGTHVFVEDITLAGIRKAKEAYQNTDLKARLMKHHNDKTDALFYAWTETWLTPEFKQWNIEHFLPRITCPVLTIYGDKDEYGSLLQAQAIYTMVSGNSETLVIPGIGHSPQKEAKEQTMKAVTDFLDKQVSTI